MRVLSINCGSSSLKYALFDVEPDSEQSEKEVARGGVDRIGSAVAGDHAGSAVAGDHAGSAVAGDHAGSAVAGDHAGSAVAGDHAGSAVAGDHAGSAVADHATAVRAVLDELERRGDPLPEAVGHRIVHGGADLSAPARVNGALLEKLRVLVPFAPLHLPPEIAAIEAVAERWPDRPQVACFDTAFHRTLSSVAQRYALPDQEDREGLRRYGFHGLSYEYVVAEVGPASLGRAVLAHLGSGASMAAVSQGRSVDTTMGFSPTGGLVMGTRLGDVDPGLLVHWLQQGRDAKALDALVNRRSGLLGISGTTADVRDLLARRGSDPRAALAIDVFTWSARKWVGAMAAALGGLDTLVFTGGIGEHASVVRAEIARGLEHLGVRIDEARNARSEAIISADDSPCTVRVVKTDEERMVARHTARVAGEKQGGEEGRSI